MINLEDEIYVENVVCSTDFGGPIDLKAVAPALNHHCYDPEHHPGIVYRIRDPKGMALVYPSGRIVSTGTGSFEASRRVLRATRDKLREAGANV